MIVVTGSTGHVGRELVAQLLALGEPVRAVTRRPATAALPPAAEVGYGDCEDVASLDAAFAGGHRAFLMSAQPPGTAEHPTHDLALVDAAQRAGLGQVVKLSVYDGGRTDDVIGVWHREAEAAVTASSMDWTLLRPGRFMSNTLQWAAMIRRGGPAHVPFANRPAAAIDPADIAAVAAHILTTGAGVAAGYQLSGPEVLTPHDELAVLSGLLGRPLRLMEPSLDATRAGMLASGMPAAVVDGDPPHRAGPARAATRNLRHMGVRPRQCIYARKGGNTMTNATTTEEQARELGRRWADAEMRGDVAAFDALSTADFTVVGPRGFVLNKQQWLDRYRTGSLLTRSLAWEDVEVRDYGTAAVSVGRHTQEAAYEGHPSDGSFRATHIAVLQERGWLLAGMHLSPMAGPPPSSQP